MIRKKQKKEMKKELKKEKTKFFKHRMGPTLRDGIIGGYAGSFAGGKLHNAIHGPAYIDSSKLMTAKNLGEIMQSLKPLARKNRYSSLGGLAGAGLSANYFLNKKHKKEFGANPTTGDRAKAGLLHQFFVTPESIIQEKKRDAIKEKYRKQGR